MNFTSLSEAYAQQVPFSVNITPCFQSNPCHHYVTYNGKTSLMNGFQIHKLYRDHGLLVPVHFQEYSTL